MFKESKNIQKLRDLVSELPIRDAEVFKMREILELTLELTTDGYWDWDVVNNSQYLSPAFKKQLGYEVDEMDNKPEAWMSLIRPEDLTLALSKINEHTKSKGVIPYRSIGRYTHKNGHEITILCRGSVIEWDEDNNPIRMVGTHIDITDL
tara:strand:+ start:2411 stop:2860 length:450 start_codon:yes stop_codon:yes gene_type:complete